MYFVLQGGSIHINLQKLKMWVHIKEAESMREK